MDQIKYSRYMSRNQYRTQIVVGQVVTVADLQLKVNDDIYAKNNAQSLNGSESEKMGLRALELTNRFRQSHGLSPLNWHIQLHDIAMTHCKNMADLRVPIGHDGFAERERMV